MIPQSRYALGLILLFSLTGWSIAAQNGKIRDLDLAQAVRLAKSSSMTVRANSAALEAAQRAVWTATSAFFPKISASATGAWLGNPPKAGSLGELPLWFPLPQGSSLGTYSTVGTNTLYTGPLASKIVSLPSEDTQNTYFKGSLTLTQPLLAWGKIGAGVSLASLEAELAQVRQTGSEYDAARAAKRSYNAALLSRESAALMEELVALATTIVLDRRKELEAGDSTRADVLSSESDLAGLRSRLVQAREGERSALEALAFYTGLDPAALRLVSDLPDRLPAFDEEAIKRSAPATSTEW
ncbi:MAG: TolC family protein, partial [Spirochaetota bacterium]